MLMCNEQYDIRHLLYQNSGDISGERDRVVGYHAFAFLRPSQAGSQQADSTFTLTSDDKKLLKDIALQSIRDSLDGKPLAAANSSLFTLHSSLKRPCGAFVSLHKQGRLRGCIGHFGEDVPLYEIVAEMARAAAFQDPRFSPVTRDELNDLDIEISVLTPMRRIQSLDEFELHRHGIYIRKGYRSGTYLPQVADEVNWTKEEFVSHCSQDKAGLGWDGWKDAELYVYEAIVF
jgi:AmmeMemoRadiSam system protein A